MHDSFDHYMVKNYISSVDPSESTQSDLSNTTGSPEPNVMPPASSASLRPNPSVSCGCLSSLYLTMDSLANISEDIPSAIRTVRHASKVAHNAINCSICSPQSLTEDATAPVSVQAYQNLMLLAALIPSACNVYAEILRRVDAEVERARHSGGDLWFSFREIGGAWSRDADENGQCYLMQNFNEREMPPDMWRSAIRDIINTDINGPKDGSYEDGTARPCLRDVITRLEDRSHKRHGQMDAAVASGEAHKHGSFLLHPSHYTPQPPEQRQCLRLLDHAKLALSQLANF